MRSNCAMPLAFMNPGQEGELVEVRGMRHLFRDSECAPVHDDKRRGHWRGRFRHSDGGHGLEHRLMHMGLIPGHRVRVIQNNAPGPIIIAVKDSRYCLGRGIAGRLMVRPDDEGHNPAGTPVP